MKKQTLVENIERFTTCEIYKRKSTGRTVLICEHMTDFQSNLVINYLRRVENKGIEFYWDVSEISENNNHLVIVDYEKFED